MTATNRPVMGQARVLIALAIVGVCAVSLAWIGWRLRGIPAGDALFKSLHVLSLGSEYDTPKEWGGSPWVHVARWLGLLFFGVAAFKTFGAILGNQITDLRAQLARRDIVLIGNSPSLGTIAGRLSQQERKVLWLASGENEAVPDVDCMERPWLSRFLRSFRIGAAKVVIIAYDGDDFRAANVVVDIMRAGVASAQRVILLTPNPVALDSLGLLRPHWPVRVISPLAAASRSLNSRYPPFEWALERKQRAIHVLLVGMGDAGEALLVDILLSSLVSQLGKPQVTVIDSRGDALAAGIQSRFPEIESSVNFRILGAVDPDDSRVLPVAALTEANDELPFTAAYVCLPTDRMSLDAAMALRALADRASWSLSGVFVRQRHDDLGTRPANQGAGGLKTFGGAADIVDGLELASDDPDGPARKLYEAYCGLALSAGSENPSWQDLDEADRERNRQSLSHVAAKLASAGVSLSTWLASVRGGRRPPYPPLPPLHTDPMLREALAALEHRRWAMQRRLSGWRFGPIRDVMRREHPELIGYDDLSNSGKDFDRIIIDALHEALICLQDDVGPIARTNAKTRPKKYFRSM